MTQPTSKWHQPIVLGQNNSGSHGNFGVSGSKGIPKTMGSWERPKDAKADFKGSSKSTTFDKHSKRKRSTNNKNYDSWNKAKKRLSTNEIQRRRNTSACMNCGEVGHVFNECPKPNPWLLETVVDIAVSTPQTPISELPSVIDESCVIKLNSDSDINSTKHQLNDAFVIRREIFNTRHLIVQLFAHWKLALIPH